MKKKQYSIAIVLAIGITCAYNVGKNNGYANGVDDGSQDGYDKGFAEGVKSMENPKGDGTSWYVEMRSGNDDEYMLYHSTARCLNINQGVVVNQCVFNAYTKKLRRYFFLLKVYG